MLFVVSPCTMDGYNFVIYALFAFKSRIILNKLSPVQLQCFRKLERSSRNVTKYLADIEFNKGVGFDGIPYEFFKKGGQWVVNELHKIFGPVWEKEGVPITWN